jgi:4a-hydroxytetrahydrobiopterin dehydratase
LEKGEIKARLRDLDGWELSGGQLKRKYRFANFAASMEFVNRVAGLAESADHHPDISIKYDRVKLTLSTHSEGGVTDKDFALAAEIDGASPGLKSAAGETPEE